MPLFSTWKREFFTTVVGLFLIIGSVYIYKHYITPPSLVTPEHALPWQALEEAYKALNGQAFLYANALDSVKEMEQKTVAVYGYIYPVEMGEKHTHFLLSKQPHICQFHLPSHSRYMVEVFMEGSGITFQRDPVLLTGVFSVPNDRENGITFRLDEAEIIDE